MTEMSFLSTSVGELPPLKHKQQRFCEEYVIDGNGTRAAVEAGYSSNTAATIASENLRKPNIAAEIERLFAIKRERNEVSVESLTDEYRTNLRLARDEGQAGAANGAVLGIAKLHGMATDKATITHTGNLNVNHTLEFIEPNGPRKDTE